MARMPYDIGATSAGFGVTRVPSSLMSMGPAIPSAVAAGSPAVGPGAAGLGGWLPFGSALSAPTGAAVDPTLAPGMMQLPDVSSFQPLLAAANTMQPLNPYFFGGDMLGGSAVMEDLLDGTPHEAFATDFNEATNWTFRFPRTIGTSAITQGTPLWEDRQPDVPPRPIKNQRLTCVLTLPEVNCRLAVSPNVIESLTKRFQFLGFAAGQPQNAAGEYGEVNYCIVTIHLAGQTDILSIYNNMLPEMYVGFRVAVLSASSDIGAHVYSYAGDSHEFASGITGDSIVQLIPDTDYRADGTDRTARSKMLIPNTLMDLWFLAGKSHTKVKCFTDSVLPYYKTADSELGGSQLITVTVTPPPMRPTPLLGY